MKKESRSNQMPEQTEDHQEEKKSQSQERQKYQERTSRVFLEKIRRNITTAEILKMEVDMEK